MSKIQVTPLGAGQDVGRSCILLTIGGKNVMLDCGMHMGFNDDRRFPDFSFIAQGNLNQHLSCVIISHFHLDHCGALPYMTEMVGYNGPIYMTMPTKAICPILLEDYRRITVDKKGETNFFTSTMVKDCMKKVTTVGLHETVQVDDELEIKAYYAGHVLGAAMFLIKVGSQSVVYTGDFNTTPDRHLGAAWIDKCRPDLLITESTYATTIRDSKRCRERDFLTKVHDCVEKGGKVLIPVFALGRAQEMCILLETYWERMNLKIPIYFAVGLTEKATTFYKMFITWTNQKIKKTFVHRNMFDFKHIKPFDRAYVDNPGPMVVFATPGMLHSGLSVQIFRKWAPNENNMLIMPGYCVAGTVGHKVISGAKKIEFENRQIVEVKMSVQYMSFSAHADAKGIMQLIQHCEPSKVLLVHGEACKMEFLKKKINQELGKECFMPANGETISLTTPVLVPVDTSLSLVKKQLFQERGTSSVTKEKISFMKIRLMEADDAMSELGLVPHHIRFTSTLQIEDPSCAPTSRLTDFIFAKMKSLLENHVVQMIPEGSITVASVLIRVDAGDEDTKSICVSWGYQDEELGKYLLPAIKKWAMETK